MCYLDSKAVGFDVNYCTDPRILCMKWEREYCFEQCVEGDALPRLYQIWKCKETYVLFSVGSVRNPTILKLLFYLDYRSHIFSSPIASHKVSLTILYIKLVTSCRRIFHFNPSPQPRRFSFILATLGVLFHTRKLEYIHGLHVLGT